MPNIYDYLLWRGDLPFSLSPFNEVDNLILSELSFIDFSGVLSSDPSEAVTLSDAARRLSIYREEDSVETGVFLPQDILPLFYRAAESRRFGNILLCAYESRTDTHCEAQFAAVSMLLGDGTIFVSFRGTDDTLVGWKEDFNMSFLPIVPSQSYAARYLSRVASVYPEQIRIGGHSKGGNLAVFAGASAPPEIQHRILGIYNNDGPGFSRAFLDSDGYMAIRSRVETIIPQTSIVGMLLEHEGSYTIVRSTQNGLFQHDGFSWEVLGTGFIRLADRTEESKIVDRTLKKWVAALTEEEREEFVEAIYAILSSTDAETLSDIRADKTALVKILKSITPEKRVVLQKFLRGLIYEGQRVLKEDREEKKQKKKKEKEDAKAEKVAKKASDSALKAPQKEKFTSENSGAEEFSTKAHRGHRGSLMVAVRPIRFRIEQVIAVKKKHPSEGTDGCNCRERGED